MFRRTLTASLALALFFPALLCADDAVKMQDKGLDGKWESVSVVIDGDVMSEFFVTMLIENDKVVMTEGTRITIAVDNKRHVK